LYEAVYPGRRIEKFDWLLSMNPAGSAHSFVALDTSTDKPIGCAQVIPARVMIDGEIRSVGQLIDGMMLPEYRGQGVFSRLTKMIMAETSHHFEYIIGFPNELSIGPCRNAGFEVFSPMSTFVLPLRGKYIGRRVSSNRFLQSVATGLASPLVSMNRRMRGGRGTVVTLAERGDLDASGMARMGGLPDIPHAVATVRDPSFLTWRFFRAPTRRYVFFDLLVDDETIGYVVVREQDRDREIVDLYVRPSDPQLSRNALQAIALDSRSGGFDSLQIQCPPTNYFVTSLRLTGFWERKESAHVIMLPVSERAHALRSEEYFMTHADSDWI